MQEIPFVWIDGAPAAGKTMLIERLLQSSRKRDFAVVRLAQSDSVTEMESDDGTSEESKRYEVAGAIEAARLFYPPKTSTIDYSADDEQTAMSYVRCMAWRDWEGDEAKCDALICEGANDFYWRSQVRVFVARPFPAGQSLATREIRERFRLELDKDTLPLALSMVGLKKCLPLELLSPDTASQERQVPSDVPETAMRQLMDMASNGVPVHENLWGLQPGYENIVQAAVIIINIHNEKERPAAMRLVDELRRLRTDCDIAKDIISLHDYRGKLSIYICNLANQADQELTKALTRIKRPVQEFRPKHQYRLVSV